MRFMPFALSSSGTRLMEKEEFWNTQIAVLIKVHFYPFKIMYSTTVRGLISKTRNTYLDYQKQKRQHIHQDSRIPA